VGQCATPSIPSEPSSGSSGRTPGSRSSPPRSRPTTATTSGGESGATRVGPQHLRNIAQALAISDDLGLFFYAWLVDRFSPKPGQGSVDLARGNVGKTVRQLPGDLVDLGEHKHWVVEAARHADVAQLYLVARYRRRGRIVLPPVDRSALPARSPSESVLEVAYGDVVLDAIRLVARALITSARRSDATGNDAERVVLANLAPMLASPEAFDALDLVADEAIMS